MLITDLRYRRFVNLYLAFVGLATLLIVALAPHFSRNWIIADWLINYEGGFVRRGLPGEAALLLARLLHLPPALFPVLFCGVLYGVLLLATRALALRAAPSWWTMALLASPATFAFPLLDTSGAGRKELIYLAALALLLVLLQKPRLSPRKTTLFLAGVVVLGALSHESVIFYTPYFFAAVMLSGRSFREALRECAPAVLLGALVVGLCGLHPGNVETATGICSSLGENLSLVRGTTNEVCGGIGAITYLTITGQEAVAIAHGIALENRYLDVYPLLALLALVPAAVGTLRLRQGKVRRGLVILWAAAFVSFAGSLTLFIFAIDWGRWMYMHAVSLALLLFFLAGRERLSLAGPALSSDLRLHPMKVALLAVYALCWTLPNASTAGPRMGYIDLARSLGQRVHRHVDPPAGMVDAVNLTRLK